MKQQQSQAPVAKISNETLMNHQKNQNEEIDGQEKSGKQIGSVLGFVEDFPPTIGMIGSILFFVTMFSLATPNSDGYEQFRKCHGNCVNGVLHGIGMPLAVSGVFMIVRSFSNNAKFTRHLQLIVVTINLTLYFQYETSRMSPILFYLLYMFILDGIMYNKVYTNPNKTWTRESWLIYGILLIFINVGALETIGHGVFENHHSYVSEFFNSVFHTPLYGINSILTLLQPRQDHTCWN